MRAYVFQVSKSRTAAPGLAYRATRILDGKLQQAGVQTLVHPQVRRQDSQLGQGFSPRAQPGAAPIFLFL
jgi:hypothetical protein